MKKKAPKWFQKEVITRKIRKIERNRAKSGSKIFKNFMSDFSKTNSDKHILMFWGIYYVFLKGSRHSAILEWRIDISFDWDGFYFVVWWMSCLKLGWKKSTESFVLMKWFQKEVKDPAQSQGSTRPWLYDKITCVCKSWEPEFCTTAHSGEKFDILCLKIAILLILMLQFQKYLRGNLSSVPWLIRQIKLGNLNYFCFIILAIFTPNALKSCKIVWEVFS